MVMRVIGKNMIVKNTKETSRLYFTVNRLQQDSKRDSEHVCG